MATGAIQATEAAERQDPLAVPRTDPLQPLGGNAAGAAHWDTQAGSLRAGAYRGLEAGRREGEARGAERRGGPRRGRGAGGGARGAWGREQGSRSRLPAGPLNGAVEMAVHLRRHGDSVVNIALSVPDAAKAYWTAVEHGARGIETPRWLEDDQGRVQVAAIATYGEVRHTFIQRDEYQGAFLPGYEHRADPNRGPENMLLGIDHVVGNVQLGHMEEWVRYYERVFGMTEMIHFSDEAISTEYSALMSKVVTDGSGRIKFPINEPAQGKRKSQIEEYIDFYRGAGALHIAVATTDIVATVEELTRRGVGFLPIPESYYAEVPERIGEIDEDIADLRRLGILVDRDDEGYLLQIFSKPVGDRPTVFFEVIQRHGARGFGEGNFKALFEALEREQDRRGNL